MAFLATDSQRAHNFVNKYMTERNEEDLAPFEIFDIAEAFAENELKLSDSMESLGINPKEDVSDLAQYLTSLGLKVTTKTTLEEISEMIS